MLVAAASLAVVFAAVAQLWTAGRYGSYTGLAQIMRGAGNVSVPAVERYGARLSQPLDSCRSDIRDAAADVAMRRVELHDADMDATTRLEALRIMEMVLRDNLACTPADGMILARLAVVRWFLGGSADEQARLLLLSQAYAPTRLATIRLRMLQWRRVSPRVIELAGDALRADSAMLLHHAPLAAARSMLADAPPVISAAISEQAPFLDQKRREQLSRMGFDL